jgi:succinate-semialdehyde dehydrogenase/glutarate-semialdehyde dehydrogenase
MPFVATNPYNEEVVATYDVHSHEHVERALDVATSAFAAWRITPVSQRALLMNRAAELLESEIPVVAELMTKEMGKTFASAKGEASKCAMTMRYFAEHTEEFLRSEVIATSGSRSGVRYEPTGPILAIMPWNFPLWQVVRFAAPALMAGNVVVLKHAPNVPGCALYIENLFTRAGFAAGLFTNLFVEVEEIANIIGDPRIVGVTLTGSERAGRSVAALAGTHIKKCVLELGGSDPFVVAHSADLDRVIAHAVTARVQNNGQACIASKRFVVVRSRSDEFVTRFANAMSEVPLGDPMDPSTVLGPLVSRSQLSLLEDQVSSSLAKGAVALTGGHALEKTGYFYPATVLVDVPADARASNEELFGPVAVVQTAEDFDDALRIANDTPWGLGASLWASDVDEINAGISQLDAGMVFINAVVASMPELPFGGTKHSGFGRELGPNGLHEFSNIKSFYVA